MRCPCGKGELSHRAIAVAAGATGGALGVSDCSACHGMWVARETIERLVSSHAEDAMILALAPGVAARSASGGRSVGMGAVRYRPCPACGSIMNRVNYARISGIIVDVCKEHGTWFDAHELPALLDFVRRGGLDVARAKETVALADERRRLERERLLRTNLDHMRGDRYASLAERRDATRSPSVFSLLGDLLNLP